MLCVSTSEVPNSLKKKIKLNKKRLNIWDI